MGKERFEFITVRIIDWRRSGPISRGAVKCFEDAGCKVEVSYVQGNTGGAVDLIYTAIPGLVKGDTPIATSLEGFGSVSVLPGSDRPSPNLKVTFQNSKVFCVDPNMFAELERCGMCGVKEDTVMLPNPAPDIAIPTLDEDSEFTVLCPQGVLPIKQPGRVIEAARIVGEEEPGIRFVMPVGSTSVWRMPLDWLDLDNVQYVPSLPYQEMLEQYAKADIVAPFSAAEILPWTVFEAFIAAKPVIVDAIGRIQSIHRKYVEDLVGWFGTPSRIFHERWEDKYESGEGSHYLHAGTAEELARLVLELHGDEKKRLKLSNNALEWISAYEDWTPKDKGAKILDMLDLAEGSS